MKPSYLYVMGDPDGRVKIGYSINPEQRRGNLGRDIRLLWQSAEPRNDAHLVEAEAMVALHSYRAKWEWFWATPDQAIDAIISVMKRANNGEVLTPMRLSSRGRTAPPRDGWTKEEAEARVRGDAHTTAMPLSMDKSDVVEMLVATVDNRPGAWAVQHGMSQAYVSDVLAGRREPGAKILKALGLERVVSYHTLCERLSGWEGHADDLRACLIELEAVARMAMEGPDELRKMYDEQDAILKRKESLGSWPRDNFEAWLSALAEAAAEALAEGGHE